MHAFIAGLSISILFAGTAYAQDGARIRTEVHSPSGLVVDQAGVVRQAFGGLQRGDASAVIRMLDPAVRWHVTRMREFTDANDLDLQGATRFLERLAAAIRSGAMRAELTSVTQQGDGVVLIRSVFKRREGVKQDCANVVRFSKGRIISVADIPAGVN